MTLGRKIVVAYLALVTIAFIVGYLILGIREHGLWLLLMAINLPASIAIEPEMETMSLAFNWDLGSPIHVLTTQLTYMVVNGAFLFAFVFIVGKLLSLRRKGGDHAV